MVIYTIYRPITSDHPGKWVVRRWYILPGVEDPVPDPSPRLADTLGEARGLVPPGSVLVPRLEGDDDVIEEAWV